MTRDLDALGRRIDRLARRPHEVRSRWVSLLAPVLRRTGWRADIETSRLRELLDRIDSDGREERQASPQGLLGHALDELSENVARAEWALLIRGRLPDGCLGWLWRLYQTLYRGRDWVTQPSKRRVLASLVTDEGKRALTPMRTGSDRPGAGAARFVDPLIDAALSETHSLGRQRRLLEAARRLLLEARAAGSLDPKAEATRRRLLTRRIARLDRLEAAGVVAEVDLGFQAVEALQRGDSQHLHAVLAALEDNAVLGGDGDLAALAGRALDKLWNGRSRAVHSEARRSLAESRRQVFGEDVRLAIEDAYGRAPARLADLVAKRRAEGSEDLVLEEYFFGEWKRYFEGNPTDATLSAAMAVGGCFDLGFAAAPGRAAPQAAHVGAVRFPTQSLVLEPARSVDDLPQAVIRDPRTLLPDFVSGTLMARRYLQPQSRPVEGKSVGSDVRVFVLDGSSSMVGPRARMRDALLIAELVTLANRLGDPGRTSNPILYYRYFTEAVGETRRVATAQEAMAAISDVITGLRFGRTDIEGALLHSFDQVRQAQLDDSELANGQIILVTDGDADVDGDKVRKAREAVGDLPIGVSILALGKENLTLSQLAAEQRARGERVFYQFMDDAELTAVAEGKDPGLPIHLPANISRAELKGELESIVGQIEQRLRRFDGGEVQQDVHLSAALSEVGLDAAVHLDAGARARRAALERDLIALRGLFTRHFPLSSAPTPTSPALPPPFSSPDDEREEETNVVAALSAVTDMLDNFGAGALERQADAVEILQRLLNETGVPPWRYAAIVAAGSPVVADALRAVHAAARFSA